MTAIYTREAGESVTDSPYTISAMLSPAEVLANYDITYNMAEFTIDRRSIAVRADDKSKRYGEAESELSYSITAGSLAGADVIRGALVRDPGEDVGTYPIRQGTLTTGDNYDLSFTEGTLAIIKSDTAVALTASRERAGLLWGLLGDRIAFTATITPVAPGSGMPDSKVTFYDGNRKLGTAELREGRACLRIGIWDLGYGRHYITAVYSGNSNFDGSKSLVLVERVTLL